MGSMRKAVYDPLIAACTAARTMNAIVIEGRKCQVPGGPFVTVELLQDCARQGGTETSQSTDDLTRSELRGAIRGHYSRRVYIAFLIPALIAGHQQSEQACPSPRC
jgi:hypothetical protein